MGLAASCGGDNGCGRCNKTDDKSNSRVNTSRQNYDHPGRPTNPNEEEALDPEIWDSKQGMLMKSGLPLDISNGIAVAEASKTPTSHGQVSNGSAADSPPDSERKPGDFSIMPNDSSQDDPSQNSLDQGFKGDQATNSAARLSWKKAAKKALLANNIGAKIAIENKIGKKLEGWFREVALELQKGIAAEGRKEEYPNFKCPEGELFNRCRHACGFTPVRYFATMGLQAGLTEPNLALIGGQEAAGKSGSFFFLSPDQQLIAKSCTKEDWTTLLRILPEYVEFLEEARAKATAKSVSEREKGMASLNAPNLLSSHSRYSAAKPHQTSAFVRGFTETLLPRFLGLYKLQTGNPKDEPVRVLVMANVFGGAMSISRRYDLKGSTHGRKASKKECAKKAPTYKDIDWVAMEQRLGLSVSNREMLLEAIKLDLSFLAKHGLMDYSLLVGVHDMAQEQPSAHEAMNVVTVRDQTRHCYLGIIDVLTPYKMRKRAETFLMGKLVCGRDISCQHPKVYANRFFNFVDDQIFGELPASADH